MTCLHGASLVTGVRVARQRLARPFRSRLVASVSLSLVALTLAPSAPLWAQNTLGALTQGQPVVAKTTSPPSATALSSPLSLDATQFPATNDVCAQINSAISAAAAAGIGVVDARGFTGVVPCQTNMWHGQDVNVSVILNPNVVLLTELRASETHRRRCGRPRARQSAKRDVPPVGSSRCTSVSRGTTTPVLLRLRHRPLDPIVPLPAPR